jgi:hypothetical protein
MKPCGRSALLICFVLQLHPASADQSIQPEDSTLPAVNFKFEFPAQDAEAGGRRARQSAGFAALQERQERLLDAIDRDSEATAALASHANEELDALTGLFQKILSFSSKPRA